MIPIAIATTINCTLPVLEFPNILDLELYHFDSGNVKNPGKFGIKIPSSVVEFKKYELLNSKSAKMPAPIVMAQVRNVTRFQYVPIYKGINRVDLRVGNTRIA